MIAAIILKPHFGTTLTQHSNTADDMDDIYQKIVADTTKFNLGDEEVRGYFLASTI